MTKDLWRCDAADLAQRISRREVSAREAVSSVLARIDQANPAANALVDVMHQQALAEADAADLALAHGRPLGPLHGVPVTVKVNVDTRGRATTDGVAANKDLVAQSDSPVVANLRAAGAIVVGRSNTPAFSIRWFTDNDLHGRTLNPFDAQVTPGGSSGGAAAAVALGMGAIGHGNDYGGSVRYPAVACGVVGLRTTVGRVPAYKASAPIRTLSNQMMSVQGSLTRSVADARLALLAMATGHPLDPQWVGAPLRHPPLQRPLRVALFKRHAAFDADASVVAALEQAALWLSQAGCAVEEAEPPHFEEGAVLWRQLVADDLRRAALAAVNKQGDAGVQAALRGHMHGLPALDGNQTLEAYARRFSICRDWALFLNRFDVLLMPVSWQPPFPIDADTGPPESMQALLDAQSPLLGTAMMGLPGLSVPTGLASGLPTGVQLVATKFREDLCLQAGEIIEAAAAFSALQRLAPTTP